jgi:hypothetical protein
MCASLWASASSSERVSNFRKFKNERRDFYLGLSFDQVALGHFAFPKCYLGWKITSGSAHFNIVETFVASRLSS